MGLTAKKIENSDQTQKQDLRILLQLSSFIKPYKKIAFVAFIALIITSLSFLLLGQGIKLFIDEGIYNLSRNELFVILLVLMTLVIGTFIRFYFISWIGERISNDVRLAVFNHLLTLHPHYFEVNRSGEINARLTTDTTLLQSIFGFSISMALSSVLLFIGGLIMMIITNIKLALIVLISVPVILLPMAISQWLFMVVASEPFQGKVKTPLQILAPMRVRLFKILRSCKALLESLKSHMHLVLRLKRHSLQPKDEYYKALY